MPLWQFDTLNDYLGAGRQRLVDAKELLQAPTRDKNGPDRDTRHLRAAVYLAGYAVECGLKAYIISRVPGAATFTQAIEEWRKKDTHVPTFSGRRAHNLVMLFLVTDLTSSLQSESLIPGYWSTCARWNPQERYNPKPWTGVKEAREFVQAAEAVWDWVNQRRQAPAGQQTKEGAP